MNIEEDLDKEDLHIDWERKLLLDENEEPTPKRVCICHAFGPNECICGGWEDVTGWDYD